MADEAATFASVEDRTFVAGLYATQQKYVMMTPHGWMIDQPVSLLIAFHGHGSDRLQFVKHDRD